MKTACLKAGAKLAIGLSLVAALIGIRLVTATPEGVEAGIEELERLDARIASESSGSAGADSDVEDATAPDSIVSRISSGVRDHLPSGDSGPRDGDKLVSCRLGSQLQFMRADDCAMRGGDSTVVDRDR